MRRTLQLTPASAPVTYVASLLLAALMPYTDPQRFTIIGSLTPSSAAMVALLVAVVLDGLRGLWRRKFFRVMARPAMTLYLFFFFMVLGSSVGLATFARPLSDTFIRKWLALSTNAAALLALIWVFTTVRGAILRFTMIFVVSSAVPVLCVWVAPTAFGQLLEVGFRLRGFYDDSVYFGLHMVAAFGLAMGFWLYSPHRGYRWVGGIGLVAALLGVVLSGSRAALLAILSITLLVGLLALCGKVPRKRVLLAGFLGAMIASLIYGRFVANIPVEHLLERIENPLAGQTRHLVEWPYYWSKVLGNPLGYGPAYWEMFQTPLGDYEVAAHSTVLEALLTGGVGALLVLLVAFGILAIRLVKSLRTSRSPLRAGALLSLLGVSTVALFVDAIGNRVVTVVVALAYSVLEEPSGGSPPCA